MEKSMRTSLQKLLLALMYTVFIVGMISFYQEQLWIIFICFVGFAVCSVQYAKACKEESVDELEEEKEKNQSLTERYDDIKERNNRMKTEFENQVELKERKIEAADNEITDLSNRLDAAIKFDNLKGILPESAKFTSDFDEVAITPVIRQILREFHERMKASGITMQISEPKEEVYARADEGSLRVLFRNIIDNSVKFAGYNGKLVVTITNAPKETIVVIRNTGVSVSDEELKHIFEINYQGSNAIGGSGLGLAQAKAIVDYFGGIIYAKSSKEDGMGIFVHLKAD